MNNPDASTSWLPNYPRLIAALIFVLGALSLCWPMFAGHLLVGEDQVNAGYAFRSFGADYFKTYHSIPQWNPFLFGGLPFSAVIGHGDIFYPTAWLRWILPVGFAMSLGFFLHIALAGFTMFSLARTLKFSWTASVAAGVAFQLSGNVSSMLANGHDGKLFVSALAPLAILSLFRAIREGRRSSYGVLAIVIGLCILSPAVQVAYYLMVACGLLALWLVFLDPERRSDLNPFKTLAAALGAVLLGLGVSMIQIFPILTHVKYTPRAASGASTGWDYATSYSFHIKELPTLFFPELNGAQGLYLGVNHAKTHTEYLGVVMVVLACLGFRYAKQKGILLPFAVIASLFLLISFGADTPFYSLWWHMPMMHQVRAAGMAFYLVGICMAIFAACGIERVLQRDVKPTTLYLGFGILGLLALMGGAGALSGLAGALADPLLASNAADPRFGEALQAGALRLMVFVVAGAGALIALLRGKLSGGAASALLIFVIGADSWSELRKYPKPIPSASEYYGDDAAIAEMKKQPLPFRAFDNVYTSSFLMAQKVPVTLGYHGMESFYYDTLMGGKNKWLNATSDNLWNLYAANYILVGGELNTTQVPGYHKVIGPANVRLGGPDDEGRTKQVFLYQRDTLAPWVRVVTRGVKIKQESMIPTLLSKEFPLNSLVLFSDTSNVEGTVNITDAKDIPGPSPIKAELTRWQPGSMDVKLSGTDTGTSWLLVAENWYPDWHANVDGQDVQTVRANNAMLSVAIPPGAKEVSLVFDVADYQKGKIVTLISVLLAFGLIFSDRFSRRSINA